MSSARTRLQAWLHERLPVSSAELRALTNEPVPWHLERFWFCLGGTPAYLFLVQIVTGVLLAVYYEASPGSAWESVRFITEQARYGWFLRSLHKWAATLMVASVVLHQMRVFFTGAYRRPRELNWMVGMCLLLGTLMLGFTGYSLAYEQLSYWGATVAASLTENVPLVGGMLRRLLLAGDVYGEETLSRFYVLHAAVLPAGMLALLLLHVAILRLHGIAELEPAGDGTPRTFDFFPDHVTTELALGLVLMVLLAALAIVAPADVGPRADPLSTPEVIKPEWYFYATFRWLKLFSETAAVLGLGLVLFVMFFWPLVDAWLRRRTRCAEASVWIGVVAVLAIVGLTVWEAAVAH